MTYPLIDMKKQGQKRRQERPKHVISIQAMASITAGEGSFQESVKLNNSFNLRTQRNVSLNPNVRPPARSNLFTRKSTSANHNSYYA